MIKFRLYSEGETKAIYFVCYILPNRIQMQKWLIESWKYEQRLAKRTLAWTLALSKGKQYGVLVFNQADLTNDAVGHELQHAVLVFAERKKILSNPLFYLRSPETGQKLEEKLAEVAGHLHRQFRWKCKQKGIEIK